MFFIALSLGNLVSAAQYYADIGHRKAQQNGAIQSHVRIITM
jgi:hypothetical protein